MAARSPRKKKMKRVSSPPSERCSPRLRLRQLFLSVSQLASAPLRLRLFGAVCAEGYGRTEAEGRCGCGFGSSSFLLQALATPCVCRSAPGSFTLAPSAAASAAAASAASAAFSEALRERTSGLTGARTDGKKDAYSQTPRAFSFLDGSGRERRRLGGLDLGAAPGTGSLLQASYKI